LVVELFFQPPPLPDATKQCCKPPNSHQSRRRYIADISHGCAVAQGPSPPNAATWSEGAVRCPLQTTMRHCLAPMPRPNNTTPEIYWDDVCLTWHAQ
jgi:hypothetical protein